MTVFDQDTAKRIGDKLKAHTRPTPEQRRYLRLGLKQAGGKLPLFDPDGQKIPAKTVQSCVEAGWCEPWHANPIEPSWLVCKLTVDGAIAVSDRD